MAWFEAIFTIVDARRLEVTPAIRARALADKAILDGWASAATNMDQANEALVIARELGDRALVVRALIACGGINCFNAKVARPYLTEAIALARELDEAWMSSQILVWLGLVETTAGDPIAARAAAVKGRDLAEAIGDLFISRQCRIWLGWSEMMQADLIRAIAQFREVVTEADEAHDLLSRVAGLWSLSLALTYRGDTAAARAVATAASQAAAGDLGESFLEGFAYAALALAALAEGDVAAAARASDAAGQRLSVQRAFAALNINPAAEVALAHGDLVAARRLADQAISVTGGWHLLAALTMRARVGRAQGELEQAGRDAHEALAIAADIAGFLGVPDILECVADLACDAGSYREAARLFGAAEAMRRRIGQVRFKIYTVGYQASVGALSSALGMEDFASAWEAGAALSAAEAIAYAQRGHGNANARQAAGDL